MYRYSDIYLNTSDVPNDSFFMYKIEKKILVSDFFFNLPIISFLLVLQLHLIGWRYTGNSFLGLQWRVSETVLQTN